MTFLRGVHQQPNFTHQKILKQSKKQIQKDSPQQIYLAILKHHEHKIQIIKFIKIILSLDKDLYLFIDWLLI